MLCFILSSDIIAIDCLMSMNKISGYFHELLIENCLKKKTFINSPRCI